MKKLRILHTEASKGWGGQEIRIMEEMRWFRDRGHEVFLVAPKDSAIYRAARNENFEIAQLDFTKGTLPLDVFRLGSFIKKIKPDIIGTHSSVDSWVGLVSAYFMGVRCKIRYRHVSTPVKSHLINHMQYRLLCDLIVTTGECIRIPLIRKFSLSRERVISVPTGIRQPQLLLSKQEALSMLQKELELPPDVRFVGQISVLRSWKGHIDLIEAYKQIRRTSSNYHLIIVGEGPQQGTLSSFLKKNGLVGKVHMLGHRDNPWPYFRALDVAVLASQKNEGIPQSLLQAMTIGTAVVGTDVGGIPEIVYHERTGLLASANDVDSLSTAIQRLLDDGQLRDKLSRCAAGFVKENFELDNMGSNLERLFKTYAQSPENGQEAGKYKFPRSQSYRINLSLGIKRKIVLFAQHSSWGAASNFNEMFNSSGEYDACEINENDGSGRGYRFGKNMEGKKIIFGASNKIKELVAHPDTVFFIFDVNGLKLFRRCMSKMSEKVKGRALNIFWTGNPYIKYHYKCNKWAEKYNVRTFAMLDLLRYSEASLPLMQPYDVQKIKSIRDGILSSRQNFVICHSPGFKGKGNEKGTNIIEDVLEKFRNKFPHVKYDQIGRDSSDSWLPHSECMRRKAAADVFIDKVGEHTAGGLGKSGIEGICLGVPTISSIHKSEFVGRYAHAKPLPGNTRADLERELEALIDDSDYYSKAKLEMQSAATAFDYADTMNYLDLEMAK